MRVCIVPEYPASLMTGGMQVQAEETYQALATLGPEVAAELFNWSERRPLPDLYHFMGFPGYLSRIAQLAKQAGRPYVCTLLFGGSMQPLRLAWLRLRHQTKVRLLRERSHHDAILNAAAIVTITEPDAIVARSIYGVPRERMHLVANGVEPGFFDGSPEVWHRTYDERPFVLCVGAIQRRKGQLPLVDACNALKIPLVLLGPVLPGEIFYARQVEAAMKENEACGGRWLQNLNNKDPLMLSAYAACRLFALLSTSETQPLSIMQAMAARKPVLLLGAPYTRETPFDRLPVVATQDRAAVCEALRQAWERGQPTELSREYTWAGVARQLHGIYEKVLSQAQAGKS